MIERYQLSNGVRVVKEQLPALRSVSIGIWILSGSRNEMKHNNGISHLIEHMLFKGTKNRSARDIAEAFDMIGGHANAFTSKEYTCLYAKVMDQHSSYALELMFDMLFNSIFDEEEINREKKVIFEEIAMTEDTPDDIIHDYLHEICFKDHPLALPILGDSKTLSQITREELIDYKNHYYSSNRIVISIAGNIPSDIHHQIERLFLTLPSQNNPRDVLKSSSYSDSIKKDKDTSQAHLCLGYKGLPIGDQASYSLSILNNILGGSMSSRLFQKIREELGLTYTIFSYHNAFRDNGLLTIYGATSLEQLSQLESEIHQIIDELMINGVSDKEFHNTVQQLKGQLVLGLENPNSRMHRNGRNELLEQPHLSLDELIKKLESIEKKQVQDVAKRVFENTPSKACIVPNNV